MIKRLISHLQTSSIQWTMSSPSQKYTQIVNHYSRKCPALLIKKCAMKHHTALSRDQNVHTNKFVVWNIKPDNPTLKIYSKKIIQKRNILLYENAYINTVYDNQQLETHQFITRRDRVHILWHMAHQCYGYVFLVKNCRDKVCYARWVSPRDLLYNIVLTVNNTLLYT